MAEYRYSVIDASGQTLSGVIEAENEEACRRIIAQRGLFCLKVSPASFASRSLNIGGAKLKLKEVSVFCRQFSTMLNSGISVIKSLDILHSQAEQAKMKATIKGIYNMVQRGQSLSTALKSKKGAFPDLMIHMVETGEIGGKLDTVMDRTANHFEKDIKTQNKMKSAMIYPMILGILIVFVVLILMVFVLPTFMQIFEAANAPLPLPTKILIAISKSLTKYWYIYLIVISMVSVAWMNFLKNENGRLKWDRFKTTMPVIGKLNVTIISSRFARALSTLMQSGIPMISALEIAAKIVGNKFYERAIHLVRDDIRRGVSLSTALRKVDVFPLMLLSMITIGEESGTLDDTLAKTSNFYDEEADSAVSRLVGILEPVMILVMALVVGFVVVSIILPMFGMMSTVK